MTLPNDVLPMWHCSLCNIILGTHARSFCVEPKRCGCYCVHDDGTFPQHFAEFSTGGPHLNQAAAVELIRNLSEGVRKLTDGTRQ